MKSRTSSPSRSSGRPPAEDRAAPRESVVSPVRAPVAVRWQREVLIALFAGALSAIVSHFVSRPSAPSSSPPAVVEAPASPRATPVAAGPWGALSARALWLSPPLDSVRPEQCSGVLLPWQFPAMKPDGMQRLLTEAELPADQRLALMATGFCAPDGCVLRPSGPQREALPPRARAVLYAELTRHSQNPLHVYAFRYRVDHVDPWLRASPLSLPLQQRLRDLMYRQVHGGQEVLAFSDQDVLCERMAPQERTQVVRTVATVPAELLTLRVEEGARIDDLAAYWGVGGREGELRALLSGVAARPGGGDLDVAHLLPPFAAARLYHYPRPADPDYNCHYGSMNFLAEKPDERFLIATNVPPELTNSYAEIPRAERLGDLLFYTRTDGTLLHSAAYVAADYVFTKNGFAHHAPWSLQRLADVRATYLTDGNVERIFRHR